MNIIFVDISSWISIRTFFTSDTTCPRRHWSRESRFFKILFFFFYFFKFQFWFGFGAGDSWSRESSNSIPTRAVSQSHTAIGKMNGDGRRPDLFGESKSLRIYKEEFILKNFNSSENLSENVFYKLARDQCTTCLGKSNCPQKSIEGLVQPRRFISFARPWKPECPSNGASERVRIRDL